MLALAGCIEDQAPAPAPTPPPQRQALGQPEPLAEVALDRLPVVPLEAGQVVVAGPWGGELGAFGMREEGSRPGPMSLATDGQGALYVLDQVNERILRYDATGTLAAVIPGVPETAEDLAVTAEGIWVLVYRRAEARLQLLRYRGREVDREVPLAPGVQAVTGLFVDGDPADPELWVEQEHDFQTRVVRAPGARPVAPAEQRHQVTGRPHRGAPGQRITARLESPHGVLVIGVQPGVQAAPRLRIHTDTPVVAIQELETDRQGAVYVGLLLGRDSGAPHHELVELRKVMVIWRPAGSSVAVELAPRLATDVFRPVTVSADGDVFQLATAESGVTIRRWSAATTGGAR